MHRIIVAFGDIDLSAFDGGEDFGVSGEHDRLIGDAEREQAMAFVRQFTNEVKSDGVVGAAIARTGLRGAMTSAAE